MITEESPYPEAPHLIRAQASGAQPPIHFSELLDGWVGPIKVFEHSSERGHPDREVIEAHGESWPGYWRDGIWPVNHGRGFCESLDPMRAEVRDHLIRKLKLPHWMRDGANLEPWQSAGLIACASAGVTTSGVLAAWENAERLLLAGAIRRAHCIYGAILGHPWWTAADGSYGVETGDAGKLAADTAALAHGYAIMQDANTMVLPWPGGPRVWTNPDAPKQLPTEV